MQKWTSLLTVSNNLWIKRWPRGLAVICHTAIAIGKIPPPPKKMQFPLSTLLYRLPHGYSDFITRWSFIPTKWKAKVSSCSSQHLLSWHNGWHRGGGPGNMSAREELRPQLSDWAPPPAGRTTLLAVLCEAAGLVDATLFHNSPLHPSVSPASPWVTPWGSKLSCSFPYP